MKKIILLFISIGLYTLLYAQTDFNGNWSFKEKQHITGPEYGNALSKQITVTQHKDSLIIESINVGGDGKDVTSRQTFAMNGKASITISASSKRKYTKSLAWSAEKKTLTLSTIFSMPENENEVDFTRVETWILVDGKLNIHKRSIETRSETWEVKGVYEKL